MKLYLIALAFLLATLAIGTPVDFLNQTTSNKQDATSKGVYTCPGTDFGPVNLCKWLEIKGGGTGCQHYLCFNDGKPCDLGADGMWLSFGPDQGVECTLGTGSDCVRYQRKDTIRYPGTGNVVDWARHLPDVRVPTSPQYLNYECHLIESRH